MRSCYHRRRLGPGIIRRRSTMRARRQRSIRGLRTRWMRWGVAEGHQGQWADAVAKIEAALKANPKNAGYKADLKWAKKGLSGRQMSV